MICFIPEPRGRCLDPTIQCDQNGENCKESCAEHDCFCPCDCNKLVPAFSVPPRVEGPQGPDLVDLRNYVEGYVNKYMTPSVEGSGNYFESEFTTSSEKSKSIDIRKAQTTEILNQIDLINQQNFNTNRTTSQLEKNQYDKDGNRCYCHCPCCNKDKKDIDVGEVDLKITR